MKIKEEKKIIEQTITTYVAEDGKEFKIEKECKDYEKSLLNKELENKLNSIKQISYTPPVADTDHNYVWFYITSQEDVNTINEYYNSLGSYNDIEINVAAFPCWYGIEEGYDNDVWEVGTLEDYKNNVAIMLEKIENTIEL
jgi:hypothetical protein